MSMLNTELHNNTQSVQLNPTNLTGRSKTLSLGGFRKIRSTGEPIQNPIPGLASEVLEMRVKEGSKIRNLLGFAMSRIEGDENMQVLFSGTGRAVTKTITFHLYSAVQRAAGPTGARISAAHRNKHSLRGTQWWGWSAGVREDRKKTTESL